MVTTRVNKFLIYINLSMLHFIVIDTNLVIYIKTAKKSLEEKVFCGSNDLCSQFPTENSALSS